MHSVLSLGRGWSTPANDVLGRQRDSDSLIEDTSCCVDILPLPMSAVSEKYTPYSR